MTRAAIALIALALGGCASQTALVSEYAITNAAARCAGLTACSHVNQPRYAGQPYTSHGLAGMFYKAAQAAPRVHRRR
jgi:hypothetical protein